MEQSFSQRMGLKPIKASIIQVNLVDDDLRMSLWNDFVTNAWGGLFPYQRDDFAREIWRLYFKRPIDAFTPNFALKDFKEYLFSCEWFEVYDFIEFIVKHYEDRQFSDEF